jgi:hypothetical protein
MKVLIKFTPWSLNNEDLGSMEFILSKQLVELYNGYCAAGELYDPDRDGTDSEKSRLFMETISEFEIRLANAVNHKLGLPKNSVDIDGECNHRIGYDAVFSALVNERKVFSYFLKKAKKREW